MDATQLEPFQYWPEPHELPPEDATQLEPFQYWPEVQVEPLPVDHPLSQLEGAPRERPLMLTDAPEGLPSWQFT